MDLLWTFEGRRGVLRRQKTTFEWIGRRKLRLSFRGQSLIVNTFSRQYSRAPFGNIHVRTRGILGDRNPKIICSDDNYLLTTSQFNNNEKANFENEKFEHGYETFSSLHFFCSADSSRNKVQSVHRKNLSRRCEGCCLWKNYWLEKWQSCGIVLSVEKEVLAKIGDEMRTLRIQKNIEHWVF